MPGRLEGKVAFLTGGASGIGAAQARLFTSEGASVVIADLQPSGAILAEELGAQAAFFQHDVTESVAWAAALEFAEDHFGRVDILVNNAGMFKAGSLEDTTLELFDQHVAVNQRGVFLGMRAAAPAIERAGGGAIVNISSAAGLGGSAGMLAYGTTKWAVRGMTKYAALDLAAKRIRVNAIFPGAIATPMIADWPEEWKSAALAQVPIKRLGTAREVAEMTLFLVSDESAYVTGGEFAIDGGFSI